jgi:hypothetical protein
MAHESTPLPLGYHGPQPKRARYVPTAEDRRWRNRRILLRLGIFVALFAPIALYFGPNLIMFGTLTRVTPVDFASLVQPLSISIVRAMKEYQRDTHQLPVQLTDLVPKYLPTAPNGTQSIFEGYFMQQDDKDQYGQDITYDFTPGSEGWMVDGAFLGGRIPLPPVAIGPATRPSLPSN